MLTLVAVAINLDKLLQQIRLDQNPQKTQKSSPPLWELKGERKSPSWETPATVWHIQNDLFLLKHPLIRYITHMFIAVDFIHTYCIKIL